MEGGRTMSNLEKIKADAKALAAAVEEWSGAPLHPIVVEARMLLATTRAKILMAEMNSAAIERGTTP